MGNILKNCEKLCEIERDSTQILVSLTPESQKLKEDFILFDMDQFTPDAENQKLMSDFKVANIALFWIKQRVDRITMSNPFYNDLIAACYSFLVGYAR